MRYLVLLLLLVVLLLPISACKDKEPHPPVNGGYHGPVTTIIVHYYRYDENYADWDLWIWPQSKEGKGFAFTSQDSYGVIAQVQLEGEYSTVGLKVRRGGNAWEEKDITWDRFIEDIEERVEIWLLEGDPTIYFSLAEVPK